MCTVRRRVYYTGRVQGVGFRYTCQTLAHEHSVAGYVRNLPDGGVELLAEGEPEVVDRMLAAIRRHMGRYIRDVQIETEPSDDPPWEDFTIRH